MEALLDIYQHPLGPETRVENCTFDVPRGMLGVHVHEYSTYGRFLFTEFSPITIRDCKFFHGDTAIRVDVD